MKESNTQFYTVSVRTFVIPFYYGSGSAKAKSYSSYYGSISKCLPVTNFFLTDLATCKRDRYH
jgi:hypothetical protein